jgi:ubiquinone/menaquinone biosynthesis C-methylase UbiE
MIGSSGLVVGIDFEIVMLRQALATGKQNIGKDCFIQGHGLNLPIKDEAFDSRPSVNGSSCISTRRSAPWRK